MSNKYKRHALIL